MNDSESNRSESANDDNVVPSVLNQALYKGKAGADCDANNRRNAVKTETDQAEAVKKSHQFRVVVVRLGCW